MTGAELSVDDGDFRLYVGDALDVIAILPDASVQAVVTSPPYLDARPDVRAAPRLEYGDWCSEWLARLIRVLDPAGSLMLNLGRLHRDGEELDYWIDVLARARNMGWKWIDTIVWCEQDATGECHPESYVFWLALRTDPYEGRDEASELAGRAARLVAASCPPGGTVLDLFAGTGSTSLAARALGRNAIAVEPNPALAIEVASRLGQQSLLSSLP